MSAPSGGTVAVEAVGAAGSAAWLAACAALDATVNTAAGNTCRKIRKTKGTQRLEETDSGLFFTFCRIAFIKRY
jgi:hypothetical protein